MPRDATNATVATIDTEVERPVDRGRKRNVTRTNSTTQSITGSGGSGTVKTNTSSSDWFVDHLTVSSTGTAAGRGVIEVELQITDSNSNLITSVTGDVHDYPIDLHGHILKPGWSLDYAVTQTDSNSYTVKIQPIIRKPEPATGGSGGSGGNTAADRIDTFEDGGVTEYSGATGSYSVVSTDSVHLDNSLESSSNAIAEIFSTSGLGNYPSRGDTFSFWTKSDNIDANQSRIGMHYGVGNSNNDYFLARMNYGDNKLIVIDSVGGNVNVVDTTPYIDGLASNQWDKVQVDWSDPMTFTVFPAGSTTNAESVTVPLDSFGIDPSDGGVGWYARTNSGDLVRADNAQVE